MAFCIGVPFILKARWSARTVVVIASPIVLLLLYAFVVPIHAHRLALAGWWMLLIPGWYAWRRLAPATQALLAIVLGLLFWVMIAARLTEFLGDIRRPTFHRSDFTLSSLRIINHEAESVAIYLILTLVFALVCFLFFREWNRTDYLRGWARTIRSVVALSLAIAIAAVLILQQSPRFYSESDEPLARAWACVIEIPNSRAVGVIGSNAPFAMRYPDLARPVHLMRNAERGEGPLHERGARLEKDDRGTWQEIGAYPFPEVFSTTWKNYRSKRFL